ncbi:hypothetical protein SELMODRAFT_429492 [Selaginella moellendorffii]|uniref:Uncharacterized protein n=1 Tax=Selaginella moellendorffii TaxID=88036 RepID=D8T6C8_SELML|nr:hypothetical protein SELMODRAFT_429492 [Selaginella moellendorffii]
MDEGPSSMVTVNSQDVLFDQSLSREKVAQARAIDKCDKLGIISFTYVRFLEHRSPRLQPRSSGLADLLETVTTKQWRVDELSDFLDEELAAKWVQRQEECFPADVPWPYSDIEDSPDSVYAKVAKRWDVNEGELMHQDKCCGGQLKLSEMPFLSLRRACRTLAPGALDTSATVYEMAPAGEDLLSYKLLHPVCHAEGMDKMRSLARFLSGLKNQFLSKPETLAEFYGPSLSTTSSRHHELRAQTVFMGVFEELKPRRGFTTVVWADTTSTFCGGAARIANSISLARPSQFIAN